MTPTDSPGGATLAALALLATGPDGRWEPGIGDPTFLGWLTVAAYLAAALLAGRAARHHLRQALGPGPRPLPAALHARVGLCWAVLTAGLLLLGINKQLDLQTWLTEIGRDLARRQGWYEGRRRVQVLFIAAVAAAGAAGLWLSARALRPVWPQVRLAFLGAIGLTVFVVVRAASFHGVDAILKRGPVHLNWMLELGALAVLLVAAIRASRATPRPRPRRPDRG